MTIGENHGNGATTAQDRFSGGVSAFRQGRREAALAAESSENELPTRTPSLPRTLSQAVPQGLEPTGALDRAASLPALDLQGLTEPVFQPNAWMDAGAQAESMADHPLLRGLLLELPPRGTMPASDWLDRWFEAARSILELLYVQEAKRG
ncbi:MAG TPA: hypothetical protein VF657_11980 [Actinoplanes sp.]|jgi:hypothetical protein